MGRSPLRRAVQPFVWLARRRWFQIYLALLVASHLVTDVIGPDFWMGYRQPPPTERVEAVVPMMDDDGPVDDGRTATITGLRWEPAGEAADGPPILLLHGSPSQGARDWKRFGPRMAEAGRTVIAMDRPGFGASSKWVQTYSIRANARYALAFLRELGVERAHVVGWSQGGGVALWMAEWAPERVASLALVGSIGIQEGEGSGDYYFEHVKYALGWLGAVALPELVPHFNLIGDRAVRHAFIRDFWDTDQRPLRGVLESLETPTLILHGREDWLVAAWVAEEHHEIVGPSRLVMLDGNHFFPIGPPMDDAANLEEAAATLAAFVDRHDEPGVPVRRGVVDLAPRSVGADPTLGGISVTHGQPWWLLVLIIVLATLVSEDLTVIAVGLLIASGELDWGVGVVGCGLGIILGDYGLWALGRFAGRRVLRWPLISRALPEASLAKWGRMFDAHIAKSVFVSRMLPGTRLPMYVAAGILAKRANHFLFWVTIAVMVWTPMLLIATILIGRPLLVFVETIFHGPWVIVASFVVLVVLIRLVSYEATSQGRQRLKADLRRLVAIEFWPPAVFYLPLAPWIVWLMVRYRPMSFTCANPGIANGGGIVGESKSEIIEGLTAVAPVETLPGKLIEAIGEPAERAQRVIDLVRTSERYGGYPVVLKPDSAQRGHGVKLAHNEEDVRAFFRSMTRDAHLQRFHAGRHEVGVLWARVPSPGGPTDGLAGEIFSVTRKAFPELVGDGERTLEQLIWDHPRYRMQAKTFLRRFDAQTDRVLAEGERLSLAFAGNHAQGTMFLDGADLITPELTASLDRIARSYRGPGDGGALDFGRFDLRYDDEAALRRGEGFAIVELNGSMSESTNIYDPGRSAWWSYAVLFRQWSRLFRLGARRRREGHRPLRVRSLYRLLRDHYRGRPGSAVSD